MCAMPDMALSRAAKDFIDEDRFHELLRQKPDAAQVRDVIAKSMAKQALSLEETAVLLTTDDPQLIEEIFEGARELKKNVYGNRIVLFAPLYVGSDCVNDCAYCAFKRSNKDAARVTLSRSDIQHEVQMLENMGHKRLILVFGESPKYDAEYMAECVHAVYEVKMGHGEIRRVNLNAAPLDVAGYRTVKAAGIGTYQIFHETYHHETYQRVHGHNTRKSDYLFRLDAHNRAMQAGIDDVGIGVLFGLYEWKFETLGLVAHALNLQEVNGVGPHTVSFPRIKPAHGVDLDCYQSVDDDSFKRLVATLRLAIPYTGLICTARENPQLRRDVMSFGVSQIDAGTRLELGGYSDKTNDEHMEREQFKLGDGRSLDAVMRELMVDGYIPSFCTACYRLGRTGEHFMEFSIPGFIKRFCTPNALSTLLEYLVDYASPETKAAGEKAIADEIAKMEEGKMKTDLLDRLKRIREKDERDLYF